jgi:broad specificity phosphatase PhoE
MAEIVLLRHAEVVQIPDLPTQQWRLSNGGRVAAAKLATHPSLAGVGFFLSGDEAKMVETATACAGGRPVVTSPNLRELNRDAAGWLSSHEAYVDLVRRIFCRPNEGIQKCESAANVLERIVRAIDTVLIDRPREMFAVVSGGLALSIYLSYLLRKSGPDYAIWKSIGFPDIAVVDPRESRVIRGFGSTIAISPSNASMTTGREF